MLTSCENPPERPLMNIYKTCLFTFHLSFATFILENILTSLNESFKTNTFKKDKDDAGMKSQIIIKTVKCVDKNFGGKSQIVSEKQKHWQKLN